jgi:hypothetical protein
MENVTLDNREGIKHLNWNITKVTIVEKIKITHFLLVSDSRQSLLHALHPAL